MRQTLCGVFAVLVSCFAGIVGFGICAVILPADYNIWLCFIPGGISLFVAFWYLSFHRPAMKVKRLQQEILKHTGCCIEKVTFRDGSVSSFKSIGAIWVGRSRNLAMSWDPINQLGRMVRFNPVLLGEIDIDWVFGLETLVDIEILPVPQRGLGNRVRRLLGLAPKTAMMLRQKDVNGQHVDMQLDPIQIEKAREIARQVNFHRPQSKTNIT